MKEAYNERWDRLVAVKSHYDHRNFFRWEPEHPADSDVAQSVNKENETSREF
ncbi:MAG TPA: BBE domain-containing protein [Candidatus Dormibacteraeota bacterium]|nr:BBE domain-containing protein [Candidatus Dormibacteraeota bacterium]